MAVRILLVNPPIYDFSAHDFWLKPYGLLTVAGYLRRCAEIRLFDFLDRFSPLTPSGFTGRGDSWGRGQFYSEVLPKPAALAEIPRRWRRFGLPASAFRDFLAREGPFDFALVQTVMTYWYPGVREVVEDIRRCSPAARIVLGGVYATLCPDHAGGLGADLVVAGSELEPLWRLLGVAGDPDQPPFWEGYEDLRAGAVKLTDGCPLGCTYCAVPLLWPSFSPRPAARAAAELELLCRRGAGDVAFYDDALLLEPEKALIPFLNEAQRRAAPVRLHTPNALHARWVTADLAGRMVRAGVKSFYLGFESASADWQQATGAKVSCRELARAVDLLAAAGAEGGSITAYLLVAHPRHEVQQVEQSMRFAHGLGVRVMLAEYSPIPGTPDGHAAAGMVNMAEPLWHNKTAYAIAALGAEEVNRLKQLCRELNRCLG